jgi:ABC-type Fe3+ transport system permease subunit
MQTMVGLIYRAIESDNSGRASAAALILFCLIFVVTMINLRVSNKKKSTEPSLKDVGVAIKEKFKAIPWNKEVKPIVAWNILAYVLLLAVTLMIIFWVVVV